MRKKRQRQLGHNCDQNKLHLELPDPASYVDHKAAINETRSSCYAVVEHYLQQIEQQKDLNAFLEVFADEALERAKKLDKKSEKGKLHGLVVGLKDNLCYKAHNVSASSKVLENFTSLYSATVVDRLLEEDAIIIGRLNCDEFAMGSSNENSAYGNVLNPYDQKRVPGGSSGGSAAAVAAGLCNVALGSDTGGSIRQPASFCGVVGFKPTYGRVSRYGLIAYASSYDQIGTFSNSVEDAALVMEVIAGKDEYDATAVKETVPHYSKQLKPKEKYSIAYLNDIIDSEGIAEDIKNAAQNLYKGLSENGHQVAGVDFPYLDYMVPAYYVLTTAEASSNLARYDGVHFGYASPNATDLESTYKLSRSEGFGSEVKRRIMAGTFVLSEGYYDAYYGKAQKIRRLITDKTEEILNKYDFIIIPTTPTSAFKIGAKADDPIAMYLADIFTVQANHTGMPAISLPLYKDKNGLPFGMQVISKKFKEAELLAFSKYLMDTYKS